MTTRIHTIAALLVAGAALGANPALAAIAVVAGHQVASDELVSRDAPFTLPGTITAMPTPKVDAAALSRGLFDDDPQAALDALTTVTFSRDGITGETPPSDALRGIFDSWVQGHTAG